MGWVGGGAFSKILILGIYLYLELCIQFRDQSLGWGGVGRF